METKEIHVVTGAFGYSGKYIALRLLTQGHEVRTLTNSLHKPNPFGDRVRPYPFHFDQPDKLVENLRGAKVLYNTYWVRFNHKTFAHETAVSKTADATFDCDIFSIILMNYFQIFNLQKMRPI